LHGFAEDTNGFAVILWRAPYTLAGESHGAKSESVYG
jgi:hypothetical protein